MSSYTYRIPRTTRPKLRGLKRAGLVQADPEVIGLIDGKTPASKEEWRVYLGILRLRPLRWEYQYIINGGFMRGGVIVDFVVWNPHAIPVQVHGAYWHKGDDRMEDAVIGHYFKIPPDDVVKIWDYEIPTQEDAYRVTRRKIR